jgi:hypothetical protein
VDNARTLAMKIELLIPFLIVGLTLCFFLIPNKHTDQQSKLPHLEAPKIELGILDKLQTNIENKLSIKQEQDLFESPQTVNEQLAESSLEKRLVRLTKTVTTNLEPSESELQNFFKLNQEDYRENSLISLKQVTYAISARGGQAYEAAMKDLSASKRGIIPIGDPNPLLDYYEKVTSVRLEELFGEDAANKILSLASNTKSLPCWSEPIRSTNGYHLICIESFELGALPSLKEVRFQVLNDWRNSISSIH